MLVQPGEKDVRKNDTQRRRAKKANGGKKGTGEGRKEEEKGKKGKKGKKGEKGEKGSGKEEAGKRHREEQAAIQKIKEKYPLIMLHLD